MRFPSIIDWLQIIAALEAAQLLVSAMTFLAVCWLFSKHDSSVIERLEGIEKGVGQLRFGARVKLDGEDGA